MVWLVVGGWWVTANDDEILAHKYRIDWPLGDGFFDQTLRDAEILRRILRGRGTREILRACLKTTHPVGQKPRSSLS